MLAGQFTINSHYATERFDPADPGSVLNALLVESNQKLDAARRKLEGAENAVIAHRIEVETYTEISDRYKAAIAALPAEATAE